MCGLTGILNLNGAPVEPGLVERQTLALAHRGPDGQGVFTGGPVGLGHRRLAIIDLSPAAGQPMSDPDSGLTIVYTGEIYNFAELRLELEEMGLGFKSRSDTEVLLKAYQVWGGGCLPRLNGMFAFAIWDERCRRLFLARDRYGVKPLYYTFQNGSFIFGSEQKAIMAHPEVKKVLDQEALLEYFTFQNLFTDRTFFENVKIFPPGCFASISPEQNNGRSLDFKRYWDFDFREPEKPAASEEEYAEELERLFRRAVNRQMVGNVEIGTYLSGGLDSGAIAAVAAAETPFIKSFTCGFDLHSVSGLEMSFDEREKAEYMSYLFKTEHYEMVLKAGDMERIMADLVGHMEEPRVGQSYPNFYVARLASKFVKVVLSGVGGDELFGGYPWRYHHAPPGAGFDDYIDSYYLFWQRLIPNKTMKKVFAPIWGRVRHVSTRDIFKKVFKGRPETPAGPANYINASLYFEAKTFLHGILVVEDKLSMAHGLETRVPFLDNELVDFAQTVPAGMKIQNLSGNYHFNENTIGPKQERFFRQTRDGKKLLRKTLGNFLPAEVTSAVKQGFSAPDGSWFKGDSIDYVKKTFFQEARIYDYMDRGPVLELLNDHFSGRDNRRLFIWSLLCFEHWLDLHG
ncbi:asparagine synthase (glutamine-hydrolyzing) (plasmid) [Deltaproteobacteria bacterium Smac51]|nr:asparagine synthase (glutamine-hydrolyzing) [Deltaproteobacteria bacterium Smac51]